ncbi:multidrug effflux MFS transporter [Halodurantibacterium flavum]|uniref:Bcr/CflA family efflux transporter n=1 Tax=Halodurantibacterium flavum TaxID=1382802 RepID=A0ABW4S530_9RHOB
MTSRPVVRFLDRSTPPHIFTLVLLTSLSALAMNVFLPSLNNMTLHFGTEYWVMQLSVSLYLAVNAVLQIFIGPVSDRFGRRPVLIWSIVAFILATIGTLLATTAVTFLFFRMAQAIVVATMVLSRAVVRDMVPQDEAASMIGYITMGMAIVPMFAPVFGGLLDQAFGWQASFVLMLAFGLLTLFLTWRDLGETAVIRPITLADQFRQYPELLVSQRFWGYCLAAALAVGGFFAYLGGAPFVGSELFGLGPAELGLYFGAPAVGYALGNFVSGRYSVRIGINRMILTGSVSTVIGIAVLMMLYSAGLAGAAVFFALFSTVGFGNGLVLPNATAGMLSVRPHLAGSASGLGGAMMIGGGAALSALAGVVLAGGTSAMPLLIVMLVPSIGAVASILFVMRRAARLGLK